LDVARLYSALDKFIFSFELRVQMAMHGQELIDGRGAQRVAAILVDEMRKNK
jgi:UDP-2,4-diacetamido-2,4,6-trideoxy-beta-L-altropyranose hydrolase